MDVATSVGVGPTCDCNGFCTDLSNCGFVSFSQCQGFCPMVPPDIEQCVCNAGTCAAMQMCIPMMSTGPSTGSGGPMGEHPPKACRDCINNVASNTCASQAVT